MEQQQTTGSPSSTTTTSTTTNNTSQPDLDEEKYWKYVQANPSGFNYWTALIGIVEKKNDINKIRKVYEQFLVEFPLCYLYWKRLADFEYSNNNQDLSIAVYEKAVESITYSVDIWINYCSHLIEKSYPIESIRSVFIRASSIIGSDFNSGKFWDKYIEFESSQEHNNLASIYNTILQTPIENISVYYDKFKESIDRFKINELLTPEEHQSYTGDQAETKKFILENRESWYKKSSEKVTKRLPYETIVNKRFFFHIQPIEESLLSTWRTYLDTMESDPSESPDTIIKLYERCLIPCCYYSEFWIKYTKYLESQKRIKEIESAFERATGIFLKRRPDVHLEYANFEESEGNIEKAKSILNNIHNLCPGHLETNLRLANFERRNNGNESAEKVYENAFTMLENDPKSYPLITACYAKFVSLFLSDSEKARSIYEKAVSLHSDIKNLWLSYINFEMNNQSTGSSPEIVQEKITNIYQNALATTSKLSNDDKIELWTNYLEFTLDWSKDIKIYRKLQNDFKKAYPSGKPESKKRPLPESNNSGSPSENGSSKRAAYSATITTPATTYQYPASYSMYYQYPTTNAAATQYGYPTNNNGAYSNQSLSGYYY
eukprot:gene5951-7411_t